MDSMTRPIIWSPPRSADWSRTVRRSGDPPRTGSGAPAITKELRPGSAGRSEIRVLFAFDPKRRAILLVAGDKAGKWKQWYDKNIPIADDRFDEWCESEVE